MKLALGPKIVEVEEEEVVDGAINKQYWDKSWS
jgi:hypothetical protein